ncbi:hypothetical protein ACJMK2_039308, partial [Sinanodonta woodiana]
AFCESASSSLIHIDDWKEFKFIQGVLLQVHEKQKKIGITPLPGYWTGFVNYTIKTFRFR